MGKRIEDWIGQYRHMDWAVLYMRLFAGGMMLFHNIGKMQDYNEIVNSYPSFASAGSAATFVVVTVAEVLLAVAIIMGIWVRMSALILSLGILLMFAWGGVKTWMTVSLHWNGGLYAFDTALTPAKPKK